MDIQINRWRKDLSKKRLVLIFVIYCFASLILGLFIGQFFTSPFRVGVILVLASIALTVVTDFIYSNLVRILRERAEDKQNRSNFFKARIFSVQTANRGFTSLLNLDTGYFSYRQAEFWKNQHESLFKEMRDVVYGDLRLPSDEVGAITTFLEYCSNTEVARKDFNDRFLQEELNKYASFFNNVEGRKLDLQQRTAIVTNEDNNLVIAGAGSGKTTTIVGKVGYVIDRYKIPPEEILLISFTNKSASTLAKRIGVEGVSARTFHKFGKDIIAEVEGKQPSIFDEKQFKTTISRYFEELLKDEKYLQFLTEYFIDYLKPPKTQSDFENQGDYIQYIKDQNFRTYKQKTIQIKLRTTQKMEVVKSIEECKIANFLFFNNVEYEYELPYEHGTADIKFGQYRPDFTITQNGRKVYLEHFGISRNGTTAPWINLTEYQEGMNWKRGIHKAYGTTLIETYSYEMGEGNLFENLTNKLNAAGIVLKRKSNEEIWKIINNAAEDEVDGFITLLGTFITLMKSNNYTITDLQEKNDKIKNGFYGVRNEIFMYLLQPIFDRYETLLKERHEIDFSDMINKATRYVAEGGLHQRYQYIIIDEFQDISIGRYKLIQAIRSRNPDSKLFCVGDDWQSIYRFSGSDISLFKDFDKYFGYTVSSRIETTYRFTDPLLKLSSEFIQKNPNQTKKELVGISDRSETIFSLRSSPNTNQDDTEALLDIFKELASAYEDIESKTILILGRYNYDFERIRNSNRLFTVDKVNQTVQVNLGVNGKNVSPKAQFLTAHKAKGLEADIVVIINCNSGKYGFPAELSDDEVLNLLLSEADQFENGEERRLFYVAMTRARERVYFVSESNYKSKFIAELEVESGQSSNDKCPVCKTADLVLRKESIASNGNKRKFYGCTNYLYGCEYSITKWENKRYARRSRRY